MNSLSVLLLLLPSSPLLHNSVAPFGNSFQLGNVVVRPRLDGGAASSAMTVTTATAAADDRSTSDDDDDDDADDVDVRSATPRRRTDRRRRSTAAAAVVGTGRRPLLLDVVAVSSLLLSAAAPSAGASSSPTAVVAGDDRPRVTHKVYMEVRISRADGSFYVRDAPASSSSSSSSSNVDDDPFYGRIVLGLFGERAPNHVARFLEYVDVPYDVDTPLPSYSRSKFVALDASTGLLIGGTIPGLEATTLAGGAVLEYSGRVFPARLWLEDGNPAAPPPRRISHDVKGLLTHRDLDPTPSFGITTRGGSTSLDATHTVFGCILDDVDGFLGRAADVPALTDSGTVTENRPATNSAPSAVAAGGAEFGALASGVFAAQRRVFRDAARTFGDSRLDKVYDGKLLRRIEVTKVGTL